MSCNLQISTEKRLANWDEVKEVGSVIKWPDLDKQSYTTHITVWPKDEGKFVMKFVVSSSQIWVSGGMGCRRPKGLVLTGLFCWQGRYCLMNDLTSLYIPGQ